MNIILGYLYRMFCFFLTVVLVFVALGRFEESRYLRGVFDLLLAYVCWIQVRKE